VTSNRTLNEFNKLIMKNVLNSDTLRRIEMTALILENPGTYSENDLSEYFDDVSVQTIRRDAAFLREMGVNIHSAKRKYTIEKIPEAVYNEMLCVYLALNRYDTIKNLKLIKKRFNKANSRKTTYADRHKDRTMMVFVKILKAINKREILEIEYLKGSDTKPEWKSVTPVRIQRLYRSIQLEGFENDDENKLRFYSFEKIAGIRFASDTISDTGIQEIRVHKKSKIKKYPDMAEYFSTVWGVYAGGEPEDVELRFPKEIGSDLENKLYIETQDITEKPDHYIMKVKVRISYEFISWLMGWGGDVKVLKPQSLIDTLLSKSKEITDTYK